VRTDDAFSSFESARLAYVATSAIASSPPDTFALHAIPTRRPAPR
jgi:hypothetical protein